MAVATSAEYCPWLMIPWRRLNSFGGRPVKKTAFVV